MSTLPALTFAKYDGDSRTQNAGGRVASGVSVVSTLGSPGYGALGLIQAVCGNKWLQKEGWTHAIGGSTTLAMLYRQATTSIATTGNPAFTTTGVANDVQYSANSDGLKTVVTQLGNHVFLLCSVNDGGGTGAAYYNNPFIGSQSINTIISYLDNCIAANKVVYLANELPRGDASYEMELKTVTGGTCTATNLTNFEDGESYGAVGCVGTFTGSPLPRRLTKVVSAPAQDQYTVASGVYVFGGTAPATVRITYNASPGGSRTNNTAHGAVMHAWFNSSDANFTWLGNDYGVPGCQYNRPLVRVFDSWTGLLNVASGSLNLPLQGTHDNLQLHQTPYASYLYANSLKTKFDADYPTATTQEQRPVHNNWYAAKGSGGAGVTYSGTLPPSMRVVTPTLISINGVAIGHADTGTGTITGTGIASGSLVFATGVWTITFTASATSMPSNAQLWFEQDIGNYDPVTLTEGTTGRNVLMNGLMDMTAAVGTGLSVFTGVSTVTGVTSSQIPYGYTLASAATNTAIANGTISLTVTSETTGDGFPKFVIEAHGVHTASIALALTQVSSIGSLSRNPKNTLMFGVRQGYAKESSEGHMYGVSGNFCSIAASTTAVNKPNSAGTIPAILLSARIADGVSGMYLDDLFLSANSGNPTDLYRLGPIVDISGWSGINVTFNSTLGSIANVPFAVKYSVGQVQGRGFTMPPVLAVTGVGSGESPGYDFGDVFVNGESTHQFTIVNRGEATSNLGTLSISGTGYSIDVGDNPSGTTIASEASRTVTVKLTAPTTGTKTGILTIPSDDSSSPYIINLTANALNSQGGGFKNKFANIRKLITGGYI